MDEIVLDEFPDFMTPTLVAHAILGAHLKFGDDLNYKDWLGNCFKNVLLESTDKISSLPNVYLGNENNTLGGEKSCAIPIPVKDKDLPNVLKFAKTWKPVNKGVNNGCN